jgi:DNA repair protein RecO (recombination protein O)
MSNEGRPAGMADQGRVFLQDGFVLHHRNYRETSLLLDILTPDFGRFRLLAKGARRRATGLSHLLQPFSPLSLSWAGRGDLPVLTGAEPKGPGMGLEGLALFCGFYLNELLLHLLPIRDSHPEVFRLYQAALHELRADVHKERVLRYFEAALLEELGYGLSLDSEAVAGRRVEPEKLYAYVVDQGPMETAESTPDSVHGSTLLGLKRKTLEGRTELTEAKRLMRRLIHHYLDGKPLKSRELFHRTYAG